MRGSGERHRSPRRILVEEIEDDPPPQRLARAAFPIVGKEASCPIEQRRDLGVGQRIDGEQVHEQTAYCGPGRLASASIAP